MTLPETQLQEQQAYQLARSFYSLRAPYAVSGTQIGKGIGVRYAMPGTDLAYGGIRLSACYAVSGTDLVYAATRLHVRAVVD
eukprot:3172636-Rhodomonas_salina.2